MDPSIENLKSTTFFGKRFTRKQLADIQATVGRFPKLSRAELGRTICEHLRWRTPGGRDRLKSARGLLEELERLGILSLPPKRHRGRGRQKPVELTSRTAPRSLIDGPLAALVPLQLEPVTKPEAVAEWNEWVQRYHPLLYCLNPGSPRSTSSRSHMHCFVRSVIQIAESRRSFHPPDLKAVSM